MLHRQHDRVALARRLRACSTRVAAEGGGDAPSAALEARVAAEQVDGHHAAVGEQRRAVAIERGAVEHRAGRLVVVEVDAQHVDAARRARIGDEARRVHLEHLAAAATRPAGGTSCRQASMTRGLSSTAVVRIFSALGQKRVIAPAPRPSCTAWRARRASAPVASSIQTIIRRTYSSSIASGSSSRIAPWTQGVPRCR